MKYKRLLIDTIGSTLTSLRLRKVLLIVSAIAFATGLYLYQLGSFINLSPAEVASATTNRSLSAILAEPVNLPYKLLEWFFLHLPIGSLEIRARLASVVIALLCAGVFYWLVRRWYGSRNALLTTIFFVASGWMLQTGRFGTGLIMLSLMVLALIAAASWVNTSKPHGRALLLYTTVCTAALFVPAGLWFVLASTLVVWPKLSDHIRAARRRHVVIAATVTATSGIILMAGLIMKSGQALAWIGFPSQFPESIVIAKQAVGGISYVAIRGPFLPESWLAHTPVLDVASTALLLLGILFYLKHRSNARVQLLATFAGISMILIALQGAQALSYMVPIIYLTIASGFAYLLHRWFGIFPHNPFAGSLAYIAVSIMLLTVGNFHIQRYFQAWRNSPDTLYIYSQQANSRTYQVPDKAPNKKSNLIQ